MQPIVNFDLSDYYPSLELMKDLGIVKEIEGQHQVSIMKKTSGKKSLQNIVSGLKSKLDGSFDAEYYKSKELRLETMRTTNTALFQVSYRQLKTLKWLNLIRGSMLLIFFKENFTPE